MQDLPQAALSQDESYKAGSNSMWVPTDIARRRRVQLVSAASAWKLVGARTCRAANTNASVQLSTVSFCNYLFTVRLHAVRGQQQGCHAALTRQNAGHTELHKLSTPCRLAQGLLAAPPAPPGYAGAQTPFHSVSHFEADKSMWNLSRDACNLVGLLIWRASRLPAVGGQCVYLESKLWTLKRAQPSRGTRLGPPAGDAHVFSTQITARLPSLCTLDSIPSSAGMVRLLSASAAPRAVAPLPARSAAAFQTWILGRSAPRSRAIYLVEPISSKACAWQTLNSARPVLASGDSSSAPSGL